VLRRSFLSLAGAAAVPAAAPPKFRYFAIELYKLKNGTQLTRLHDYFSKHRVPAMQQAIEGAPLLVMEALVAPHMPQVACLTGFPSLEQFATVMAKAAANTALMKRHFEWEQGPEPPFESQSNILIEAAPYSPDPAPQKSKTPRIFEWRVYHSPTFSQLKALHERFSGPEIKIFHRTGVHPILYASTLIGPDIPNLTYFIPFDSLDAREKAWAAFGADAEWVKVRRESIEKHGQIASTIQISLWKAAPYSPIT
jgi:hypothetical protein